MIEAHLTFTTINRHSEMLDHSLSPDAIATRLMDFFNIGGSDYYQDVVSAISWTGEKFSNRVTEGNKFNGDVSEWFTVTCVEWGQVWSCWNKLPKRT